MPGVEDGVVVRVTHARGFGHRQRTVGDLRREVVGDAVGEDEPLEERVRGEAIGAVDTRARDLARGIQAGKRCPALVIGLDTTADVVLRRGHRQQVGGRVDAELTAARDDRGKALLEEVAAEVAGVEEDVIGARLGHPAQDGAGDDIARREVGELVLALHETDAVLVDEEGPLAADRLGDQRLLTVGALAEPEHGRVELDELQVRDPRPRPQRGCHPVTGGDGGVGRRGVDLAQPTAGQHHGPRMRGPDAVDLALTEDVEGDPADPPVGIRQEVDDHRVLHDLDARVVLHRSESGDERARDLLARGVPAGVGDPVAMMAALPGELETSDLVEIEVRTQVDELADPLRALGDEDPHGLRVTQAHSGDQGVLEVLLRGVLRVERRRDPALGPGRRALVEDRLGHEQHSVDLLAEQEGTGEAGDARPDDDDVGRGRPARLGCGETAGNAQVGHEGSSAGKWSRESACRVGTRLVRRTSSRVARASGPRTAAGASMPAACRAPSVSARSVMRRSTPRVRAWS